MVPGIPNNLPGQLSSFVGREHELDEASRLLGTTRLLTLTGAGGSGKTRLSVQLAAQVGAEFPDGVCFVPLAPVTDPGLVPSSIAQNLGLHAASDRPLMERLVGHLRHKKMLLVLDNLEHLLGAVPVVAELLQGTDALRVMATSRSPLHVSGEQEFEVPPLPVPEDPAAFPGAVIATCESVRLFAERAAAASPGFVIDVNNAAAIAAIARRLDGLPLAIELAAARVKVLSPEAILPRLERSLELLVGGRRDLPGRQRTLRGTIGWSYELLSDAAKRLLAICSVFRGGADLETIESICEQGFDLGVPVLDGLQQLADQSLLRRVEGQGAPRFAMLETVREFAAERLSEMPSAARIRGCHAAAFLDLVEEAGRLLTGPGEKEWIARLDLEHHNLRAAIDWYSREFPHAALRLAAAMTPFWIRRGHYTEGRQRLLTLLDCVPDETSIRVSALNGAAWMAIDQGDHSQAGDILTASIELSRKLNDTVGEGMAVLLVGRSKIATQRPAEAVADVQRAMALLSAANDRPGMAMATLYSGLITLFTGRPDAASELFAQGVAMCSELGFGWIGACLSQLLGLTRLELGDLAGARAALEEGLTAAIDLGVIWVVPIGLGGFAGLAAKTGRPRLALRLAGSAAAYSEANELSVPKANQALFDRLLAPARDTVGAAAENITAEGRKLSLEEAVACALANEPEPTWRIGPRRTLTPRELQVAALVARGLTNRDIARQLYLSVRTVDVHVDHILTKLGFHNRTQLAAWAYETELLPKK